MSGNEIDYEKKGFKCGIEIHQQLDTGTKLFCGCPVEMEDEPFDAQVERFLRSVAGETGETDEAASVEEKKSRNFVYNYYERNNCLVELDEEPPHPLNREALDVALNFARMVDAEFPEEIQVMRKMVVDGSNTSGFQRTAMVALEGELETESGTVSVEDIELEEESAGIHRRTEEKAVYDLNRLGIPLVEVGTDASIENPGHAREVAMKIGMLLRSTGKARRGLGTIRQDVNVSIEDGSRVEIKGFQDVENIDRLIELEVERQEKLVDIGEELDEREVEIGEVTDLFEGSGNDIISTVLEGDGRVYALKIPELDGRMKEKISGERYLALEMVDYARSRGLEGMIHSDEDLGNYGLKDEFNDLRENMDASEEDVLAVLAGPGENAEEAAEAVKERAEMIYRGEVPEETRNAEQDFTTSYLRPLPGSARMYPETDIPPIRITDEDLEGEVPPTMEERKETYREEVGEELSSQLLKTNRFVLYDRLKDEAEKETVANLLTNTVSSLESEGYDTGKLGIEDYRHILEKMDSGEISPGEMEGAVRKGLEAESFGKGVEEYLSSKSSLEEVEKKVEQIVEENIEMVKEQGLQAQGALMGEVMAEVEASGSKVSSLLKEKIEEIT